MDLAQIEAALNSTTPEGVEHWGGLIRSSEIGRSTVALFALFGTSEANAKLELAGTGTLVSIEDSHYVLTAAHVWHKVLKFAVLLGISLREGINHRYFVRVDAIVPSGPELSSHWNEWGPDLILLRIPPFHVGEIRAFRSFYRLDGPDIPVRPSGGFEAHVLIGAPHSLGTFEQQRARLEITAFPVPVVAESTTGAFDYVDVRAWLAHREVPEEFGGVSGGGLWKVRVYASPDDQIDSDAILYGVAFYQMPLDTDQTGRRIRCHGPKSLRSLVPNSDS